MDFSGSNIDNCFNGAEERSSKDDGWIILVFSHVNNLKVCVDKMIVYFDWDIRYYSFDFSKCLIYHLKLISDCGHYVIVRSGVVECLLKRVSVDCALNA